MINYPVVEIGEPVEFHYKGPLSKDFWDRIHELKDNRKIYKLAVTLQNLEEQVLLELLKAEQGERNG